MLRNLLLLILLPIAVVVGLASCDNVGRAFDPNLNPNDPGEETGISTIQIVPVGGEARDGRPLVRDAYPSGDGWPSTVPIVVTFSESLNEATILPTTVTGLDARIGVRVRGTQQLLPAQYEFLANGQVLVIRPVNGLATQGDPVYEIVLLPEGRDVDGIRFQVTGGEKILGDFQVNQDESITDGSIVAVYPRDNFSDATREGDFFVVFDRPANASTLLDNDIFIQPQGGTAISSDIDVPLDILGVGDPRVVRLRPAATLLASQQYEFFATSNITFGADGTLDVNSSVPFSRYTTIGPSAPSLVELGNAAVGFSNKINRDNALNVILDVRTAADTAAGDLVVARIYGRDETTSQTFDFAYVERSIAAPVAGEQTLQLDFGGQLGTLAAPSFTDGEITFAAQVRRGNSATGFIHNDSGDEAIFDITPPTLTQAGPPGDGTDIFTECESLAYYGVASEGLSDAQLSDGVNSRTMFGSSSSGRFLVQALPLGLLTASRAYTITLTDLAGNLSESAVAGSIVQRGHVAGALGATLTVAAYDQTTLLPIAGATVLVDPNTPTIPATGQLVGTTNASGEVVFSSGFSSANTVTIIRAGFDLVTLYDTQSARVSLPLNPVTGRTATLTGNAVVQAGPGSTVIVGSTEYADYSPMGIQTSNAAPTEIPTSEIVPNRAQVITAFSGSFEPTAIPTFTAQGCEVCGATLVSPTAPVAPPAAGETASTNVVLSSALAPLSGLLTPSSEDFGLATGLDVANLVDGLPRARVTNSLAGFTSQALTGIGVVTLQAGTVYDVNANYSLPIIVGLTGFSGLAWLATEAEDTSGRISRTRALLDPIAGTIVPGTGPGAIPEITAPSGAFTGSPAVTFADTLDAPSVLFGLGFVDLTATDPAGRRWVVIMPDRDGAVATDTVQFPDLATPGVAGLAAGAWDVVVEGRLAISLDFPSVDDFVLTERFRQEVNYARSAEEIFTVN